MVVHRMVWVEMWSTMLDMLGYRRELLATRCSVMGL